MKKKGFTLIELLAAIVILAVIALVAVPMVISIINKSKISAWKQSATNLASAYQQWYQICTIKHEEDCNRNFDGASKEELLSKLDIKGSVPDNIEKLHFDNNMNVVIEFITKDRIICSTVEDDIECISIDESNKIIVEIDNPLRTYTGSEYGISIKAKGAVIKYRDEAGLYTLTESPKYINAGEYKIGYEATKSGYETKIGEVTLKIEKAGINITPPTALNLTYNKSSQTLINAGSSTYGVMQYKLDDGEYSKNLPEVVNAGTYTVYYKVDGDENYSDVEEKSLTVKVNKENSEISLDKAFETYTYPTSGKITITNPNNLELTCESNKTDIATCSVAGNVVTVIPGTTEGQADITIKSTETENYKGGQLVHVANTAKGNILDTITSNNNEVTFDNQEHGIVVTSTVGDVTYGDKDCSTNECTLTESPKYKDVGTYTVYYKVEKAGYTTSTGSKQVIIKKAAGNVTAPTEKTLTFNGSAQTLINAGSSTTGTIQYKVGSGSYSTSLPQETNVGTYTVYYKVVGDKNHNDVAEQKIDVTIGKADDNINLSLKGNQLYTGGAIVLANSFSTSSGKGYIGLSSSSTTAPTSWVGQASELKATNAGTYYVWYKTNENQNYKTVSPTYKSSIIIEKIDAPVRSKTTSSSSSILAEYNTGSATSGIKSTKCYRTDSNGNVLAEASLTGNNCNISSLSSDTLYYYKKCITSNINNTSCSTVANIKTAGLVSNFAYTGGVQNFVAPYKGVYKLDIYGAPGGSICAPGGKGGYSTGKISLSKNDKLNIYVGETPNLITGGWNGGGNGSNRPEYSYCEGPGGGATDIRLNDSYATYVPANSGTAYYGPYTPLGSGIYQVWMYGTNLNNAKYDWIDAFCNEGHSSDGVSHSFNPLLIKITDNYISYVVDVSLGSVTCSGIEFRMVGYSDTNITRVEYSRLDKRVIVAGGGGGGSNYMSVSLNGGSGGGTQAGQIYYANFPSDGISYLSNNMGASQSASGLANKDTGWSFDIELRPGTYGLGNKLAGGGYYGGSSYDTTNRIYSGTGGSGYVSSILTEASTQSKVSASYGSAYVEAVSYEN